MRRLRPQSLTAGPDGDQEAFERKRLAALATLAQFEDALVRESARVAGFNELATAEWNAQARPVAIALAGSAAFAAAVIYAGPILATSGHLAMSAGLAEGVGQVAGTGVVAALGSTGLEVINKIAIPLWKEAVADSYRRDIPISCALEKQIEIGKQRELEVVADTLADGALVGVGIAGITLIVPTALRYLGGGMIRSAYQSLKTTGYTQGLMRFRAGRFARWFGRQWDEVMLFAVVGAVGGGAVYELYELVESGHAFLHFDEVLEKAERQLKTAAPDHGSQIKAIEAVIRQLRSLQTRSVGEGSTHFVDLLVCTYLLNHFAHGEFMIALEGELEQVIEALATSADDAPTGINAAGSAVDNFTKKAAEMTPLGLKLALLNTKLEILEKTKGALSPALVVGFAEMDHYIEMEDHELHEHVIKEAKAKLDHLAIRD
jgi:hypothetical protein